MASRGAIHRNEAATDYRFRIDVDSSYATDQNSRCYVDGKLRITWGQAYVASTTGIEAHVHNEVSALGVESCEITLTTPWGTYTFTDTTWVDPADVLIEIDNLALAVDPDCTWELSFDELRWYVGAVLQDTISSQTESGSGFDLRLDIVWGSAFAQVFDSTANLICTVIETDPAPLNGCPPGGFAAIATHFDEVQIQCTFGWETWDGAAWVEDAVSIQLPTLPSTTCPCVGDEPTTTEGESWDLVVDAYYRDERTKTDLGNFVCECVPPRFGEWTVNDYYFEDFFEFRYAELGALPNGSGIAGHSWDASIDCGDFDYDSLSSSTTEATTYCELETYTENRESIQHCRKTISATGICSPGGWPCLPAFPTYVDLTCCTKIIRAVAWPTAPSCSPVATVLDYDVSASKRHARVLDDAGDLILEVSQNLLPTLSFSGGLIGVTAEWACLRWAYIGSKMALVLWTEESGAIKRRITYDEGANFSVATTIEAGPSKKKPEAICTRDRLHFLYWIDGTAIKRQARDSADQVVAATGTAYAGPVDDQPLSVRERYLSGGKRQFVLMCTVSGAVTELYSWDGLSFS